MLIRKIDIEDVPYVQKLINYFAQQHVMLPRSLNDIYENLRDFFVVTSEDDSNILGCVALHITWEDLAEIKALAVAVDQQNKGCGRALVNACLKEAKKLKIRKVFALSYKPLFFEKYGFKIIDKETMPRKIWGECVKCIKFDNCDEICLLKEF